ncbi:MAG: hypothetical protein PHH59_14725 [Methylovulum sp.]|uniref:hypothetical protein n=1 Tax=Methylovulum sp. TaxID=1916980 RepID=UPI0026278275|nr:hypothetical protein [Methylovulum sp.]MDD2725260.1 hypothetical protein [Methylovulum sp.]
MRRMIEIQHAVQYGYRLLHPTDCALPRYGLRLTAFGTEINKTLWGNNNKVKDRLKALQSKL